MHETIENLLKTVINMLKYSSSQLMASGFWWDDEGLNFVAAMNKNLFHWTRKSLVQVMELPKPFC